MGITSDGIFGTQSWGARDKASGYSPTGTSTGTNEQMREAVMAGYTQPPPTTPPPSDLDTWARNEGELAKQNQTGLPDAPGMVGGTATGGGTGGTGGTSTGGTGGTVGTGGPATDLPATGATDPFTYDPATDPEYQAAARELNRQIANAMNRRGIFGSTIMGENLTSAQAGLIGDYREQAYSNYQQKLADKQDALDRAYENARRRGYYNNEEAALWGVKPGTRISTSSSSSSSGGGSTTTAGNTTAADGTVYDKNGKIVLPDPAQLIKSQLKSDNTSSPIDTIAFLMEQAFTDAEKEEILKSWGPTRDETGALRSVEWWLQKWLEQEEAKRAAQFNQYAKQVNFQETRWDY
jgi:hypothetical protein